MARYRSNRLLDLSEMSSPYPHEFYRNLRLLDLSELPSPRKHDFVEMFLPSLRKLDLSELPSHRQQNNVFQLSNLRLLDLPSSTDTTEAFNLESDEEFQTRSDQPHHEENPVSIPAERFDELENETVEPGRDEVATETEITELLPRDEHRISIAIVDMQRPQIHGKKFKAFWKWLFVISNLMFEILASAFDQVSSPNKPEFALVGLLMSLVAMAVCVIEFGWKACEENVTWKRKGWICWFYYPSPSDRIFGTVADNCGLIFAKFQVISSIIQFVYFHQHAQNPIKISIFPVIFAMCVAWSKFNNNPNELPSELRAT